MTNAVEREYRRRLAWARGSVIQEPLITAIADARGAAKVDRVALWDAVWCETHRETPEDAHRPAKPEIGERDMQEELPLILELFSRR